MMNLDTIIRTPNAVFPKHLAAQLAELVTKFPKPTEAGTLHPLKFCDYRPFLSASASHAKTLGLDDGKPLRVADIGCGFGYFMWLCRELGHSVIGLDCSHTLHREATRIMSLNVLWHHVEERKPLPDTLGSFDLAVLHGVNFARRDNSWFTWDDYEFLVVDLLQRMPERGRIHFAVNRGVNTDFICNAREWDRRLAARDMPARVAANGNQILIHKGLSPRCQSTEFDFSTM